MKHPGRVFGVAFVFALIAAWVFACWLGPDPQLRDALIEGLAVGAGVRRRELRHQLPVREPQLPDVGDRRRLPHAQFVLFALVLALWP